MVYINDETTQNVIDFLKGNKNPTTVKTISRKSNVTKKKAFATCMNHKNVTRVDPSEVGSGKDYFFFEYKN